MRGFESPHLHATNASDVFTTPSPYTTEFLRLIELASSWYDVGHEISPMRRSAATACASTWLSKTKPSEFARSGIARSASREYARKPVWNSESFEPSAMFCPAVSSRFETYFQNGMPPAMAVPPRMREPSTRSYTPDVIIEAIGVTR